MSNDFYTESCYFPFGFEDFLVQDRFNYSEFFSLPIKSWNNYTHPVYDSVFLVVGTFPVYSCDFIVKIVAEGFTSISFPVIFINFQLIFFKFSIAIFNEITMAYRVVQNSDQFTWVENS